MVSIADVLAYIFEFLYVGVTAVGDVGDLSLGSGPGDSSPSPAADAGFPPPQPKMGAGDLFTRIRTDKGLLINMLALASALLIGFQALLGSRRRRFGGKAFVLLPLWAFYIVSFPVVSYTIGLVQSVQASHMPDSQLLWAVGLLLLLGSVNGMSAFTRHDVEQSTGMLVQHVFQTLLVLWLLFSRSDVKAGRWVLLAYFVLCWIYSILRIAQRMKALRMASSAHGLVRSAKVVADYMEDAVESRTHDPESMAECKYLVLGDDERKDSIPPSVPPYRTQLVGGRVVTVDMIWNHEGKLLSSGDRWASALRDTCLSFALFKLLKRRFCGLHIAEAAADDRRPKALGFVLDVLLADAGCYERAFRLVEVELSFLYDFFYTKYPALFPTTRVLSVIRFFVLLGFFKILLTFTLEGAFMIWASSGPDETFIYLNNILVIVMILSIDILQHLATGYTNWAIVHFVCDYVKPPETDVDAAGNKRKRWCGKWKWRGCGIRQALIQWVAERRTRKSSSHCWDNKLGQYSLLDSYGYNHGKTKALSKLSLGLMKPPRPGLQRGRDVALTAEVKMAVLGALKNAGGLPSVGHSLRESPTNLQLHWACDLHWLTHAHTVLVWHIATTMCDFKDTATDNCRSDDERRHRLVATTLSGYCAYLLAFVPDMLPDNSYKARQILDAVVKEARDHLGVLVGDTKKKSEMICTKMFQPTPADVTSKAKDTTILTLGRHLGSQLLLFDNRWEMLAVFWAELVLFLAPSDNADIHAEHLATGGEFITHIWALLTHAGIVDRSVITASPV
ncbi:hypothetical protein BS78_K067900 [Paspalum vaginatum]|uniref:DUF4220 domain-containing protein n=1 Tax=Paspalum vaginatum TaxID=158149 RepID=A0A9W8CFU3_9POAL|nr:hypothetical protein BS78_K067900 [Paspalum vaginatum]